MFAKFEVSTIKLATLRRNLAAVLFCKSPLALKILLFLQFFHPILQILHKHTLLNYQGPYEVGFLNLPPKFFLGQPKIKISSK